MVVDVKVDAVGDVAEGGNMVMVVMASATNSFDGLRLLVEDDLDEMALAMCSGYLKKRVTALLNALVAASDGSGGRTSHAMSMKVAWQMRRRADAQSIYPS